MSTRPLLFLITIILLTGCAKKVPPEGGPRDVLPATVVGTDPQSGSTNVTARSMRFVFDDYVDRTVRNAFSIMPTVRFTTSYAGDVVDVDFIDTLAPNTTYVVTLGTEYQDIRGNKPQQAVSVVFSTGPDIDTGSISGIVEDQAPSSLIIFAYPRADRFDTAFTPAIDVAPYRLPVGTSGSFTVNGLADGTYRVMAVRDANKNGVADANEAFAMATEDVVVKSGTAPRIMLRVGPAIDLIPPQTVSARAMSSSSVQVTFSEPVRIAPTTGAPFTIADSTGASVDVGGWYQAVVPDDRVIVRLRDTLQARGYTVTVAAGAVQDSAGLVNSDTTKRITFRGTVVADTTTPRITSVTPADSTLLAPDSVIVIVFSDAMNTADVVGENIITQERAITSVLWDGPTRLVVRTSGLSRSDWHRISLPLMGVRTVSGARLPDTTIVRTLKATDRIDPGSIQGVVIDSAKFGSPLLLRVLTPNNHVIKTQYVTSGVPFTVDSLPAGDVQFDVVRDVNKNGLYDHGSVRPYTPAEAFYTFRKRVTVRARWTIEDVKLEIQP